MSKYKIFTSEDFPYKFTPQPRYMNLEECRKYKIDYYNSDTLPIPKLLTTGNIWGTADDSKLPVYAFYCAGTNCLKVFKYTWDTDFWEEIEWKNIDTYWLYSVLWKHLVFNKNFTDWDSILVGIEEK
jgi:hypothetical protein